MEYSLTPRLKALREAVVDQKAFQSRFLEQREVYYTLGLADCAGKHYGNMEITARALRNVIENVHPYIGPGERMAGSSYGNDQGYEVPEDTEAARQALLGMGISQAEIDRYYAVRGSVGEVFEKGPGRRTTEEEAAAQKELSVWCIGIDSNHSVIGYKEVLENGFEGLEARVRFYRDQNGDSDFYRAELILCEAARTMGRKYAEEAERLLTSGDPAYDKADLEYIRDNCSRVPEKPAEHFGEALQSLWFAHILNCWEDGINANSLGHLDQIFYPYYQKDIDAGVIDNQTAFEAVCDLWLKLYLDYDVQQSCLGGRTADGKNLVNPLSWIMLDATEQLDFIRCMSVRFDQNTPRAFLRRALEVVMHVGKGVPFFFNDDAMIPALMSKGISAEDASNYTEIGCIETVIPGKSNPHAVEGLMDWLKSLEYVFGRGRSLFDETVCVGVDTGDLSELKTFEAFCDAVKVQIAHQTDSLCSQIVRHHEHAAVAAPKPVKSLLTEGCVESGLDFNQNGAKYDYNHVMFSGVPNLADALAVVRKFVYEDKAYTLEEIRDMLINDFPDETVRQKFIHRAPKYGNDDDSVDAIAVDFINYGCDLLEKMETKYGMRFHAQPFTYLWMVDMGKVTAASPDGRRKGDCLAYSISPMQGRDISGLTAVFNTICKLPTKRTPGTCSSIVGVDPKVFCDDNLDLLCDMLMAAGANGLSNVQFNTVDRDTLLDAQLHPEKHGDLAVRVSGFSQRFVLLSRDLQDHIIARTKHTCL